MGYSDNKRETGARKPAVRKGSDPKDNFSQDTAKNKLPPGKMGNAEHLDDTDEKTRHSDHE